MGLLEDTAYVAALLDAFPAGRPLLALALNQAKPLVA